MFIDQIEAAICAAHGARALDDISRVIWRGLADGLLNDDDAQRLADAIHTRRTLAKAAGAAQDGRERPRRWDRSARKPQRPPVRSHAIERRRRLAASGPLPPALAARFTLSEIAVLRIVADEVHTRGRCDRTLDEIAARAGVSRSTVRNAMRAAARLGLVRVTERPQPGRKNLPNIVEIVSPEWSAWIRRGPKAADRAQKVQPHGYKSRNRGFREEPAMTAPQGMTGTAPPDWRFKRRSAARI
jgi:hypothetical protein